MGIEDERIDARRQTVEITEVRIKLMDEPGDRLKAFCSITFDDCFVIRDLKIIEGASGPFVAMPSRKLTSHCPHCGMKNHLRAFYCNQCGARLEENRAPTDDEGRAKLYADIAHPINSNCREMIQERVIAEFLQERERAKQPGYVSRYDDFDYDYDEPRRERPARIDAAHASGSPHQAVQDAPRNPPRASGGPHGNRPANKPQRKGDFGAGIF
jgi:stage V sporulation protein G